MDNNVKQFMVGNLRVTVHFDRDPPNPRKDYEPISTMACAHRRYTLGDTKLDTDSFDGWEEVERDLIEREKPVAIQPLYLFDHGGISISTGPFGCRWDSGQVGFAYVTREALEANWSKESVAAMSEAKRVDTARRVIEAEVTEYDAYLRGAVYGYVVEAHEACGSCGHDEWKEVAACWGFYSPDDAETEGQAAAENHVARPDSHAK